MRADFLNFFVIARRARLPLATLLAGTVLATYAQTPDLPAAAESTAPASRIGPPVSAVPLATSPEASTPAKGSTTLTLPKPVAKPSEAPALAPLTPVPAPRG